MIKVTVSQNGGEYYGVVSFKGENTELVNHNTIVIDGLEVIFENEYINGFDILSEED